MKVNQLKIGSLLSYLQMGLSVIVSVVYTPVMLRLLGQSEYGLYSTVSSTISMLSVLSLGFNSSYIRYFSAYKAKKDEEAITRLNGLFLIIFIAIGLVSLFCGSFLSFHLDMVFDKGLTSAEYSIARKLMLMLTVNLAISFPMSVFQNIISAHEQYVFLKLLGIFKTIVSPLVALPLLLMGYRSVAMVAVTLIVSVVVDFVYLIYAKSRLHVTFVFRNIERGIFKSLFAYTFFIFLNMIVDQVNNNLDKFLLGRYQGTLSVAVYSLGSLLYSYFILLSTAVSGVFTPRIHRLIQTIGQEEVRRQTLTDLFIKVGRIQFMVLSLVASGFVFFGKPFIYYWAGEGYEESYSVALLLILPALVALIQNLGIEIQRALNKHQFRSVAYIFMAMINVFLTIVLCQRYGAVGAALGTAISLVLMNGIVMNVYYHKRCNLDILAFWKNIFAITRGLVLPIAFGIVLTKTVEVSSLGRLVFGIAAYGLVYLLSMWIFCMNSYEKNILSKPILKILKK